MTASYAEIAVRRNPLPLLVDAERAEPSDRGGERAVDEQQHAGLACRSAGGARRGSRSSRHCFTSVPARWRRPGRTCSSIFSMAFSRIAGATKRNTRACAAPCTMSPRMPLVRRSPLVSVGLRRRVGRRGCTAISNRAVRGLCRVPWCARPGSPAGARSRPRRARAARPHPHREVRRPRAARSPPGCSPASRRCPWWREASGRPARPGRDPRPRAPRRWRPCWLRHAPSGPLGRSRVLVLEAGSASYDEGVVTRSVPPAKLDAMT